MKQLANIALVLVALTVRVSSASGDYEKAVKANNEFGFNFYSAIRSQDLNQVKNRFTSPISAYLALSMLANGAKSSTEEAILKTMAATGMSREELNRSGQDLLLQLNKQGDSKNPVKLEIANSVWSDNQFRFRDRYVEDLRKIYDAEARSLDFSSPEASKVINNWVAEKTHGKITEIVEKKLESVFYLVNATYFKGPWRHPFNVANTKKAVFTLEDGMRKEVDMMHGSWEGRYAKTSDFEAIELSYGAFNEASLVVLLPTQKLASLEESLTSEKWRGVNTLLEPSSSEYSISLSLPKFKFEYESDLIKPLSKLGMAIAFEPTLANFGDMSDDGIYINKALQKTYLGMDEKGTEAAAVTVVGGVTSVPIFPHVNVNLNRPFVVVIRDNRTRAVLFIGTVADPS